MLVAPVRVDDDGAWVALDVGDGVTARELPERRPDPPGRRGRRSTSVRVAADRLLDGVDATARRAISPRCSCAAELVGVAQWCVDTAAEYAKDRVQFGRPIGQFQGVKHKCADMLCRVELARAAAWDAARP